MDHGKLCTTTWMYVHSDEACQNCGRAFRYGERIRLSCAGVSVMMICSNGIACEKRLRSAAAVVRLAMPDDWDRYEAEGNDFVSPDRWGKDHWSTLAYLETLTVDRQGKIDNLKMRCHTRLHRAFAGVLHGHVVEGSEYPTRIKGNDTLARHDDWSCLEDAVAAGYVIAYSHEKPGVLDSAFGTHEARVEMTETGRKVAEQLRAFKAQGGQFKDFVPSAIHPYAVEV